MYDDEIKINENGKAEITDDLLIEIVKTLNLVFSVCVDHPEIKDHVKLRFIKDCVSNCLNRIIINDDVLMLLDRFEFEAAN